MKSSDQNGSTDRRQADTFRQAAKHEDAPTSAVALRPAGLALAAAATTFELSDQQAAASFRDIVDIVQRQRWKLAAFIALPLLAVAVVTFRTTPLYESTVSMSVERRGNGAGNEQASAPGLGEMEQIMLTQIELIKSDPVLRPVAERYHLLDTENQFRWLDREESARLRKSRIVLKRLKVTRSPNTSILRISYRASDPQMSADVVMMIARSYQKHAFDSRNRANAIVSSSVNQQLVDLKTKMIGSDEAMAVFAKQLGFVDPEQRASALSARLLQLNADYTAAQSERLQRESVFNASKSGSLAGAQVSNQGALLEGAITRLNQAKNEFARVSTVFGEGHPEHQKALRELNEVQRQLDDIRANTAERVAIAYRQAIDRERMTHDLLASTKAEVDNLTAKAFEYQRLKTEGENYRKLSDDLERITREQVINQSFRESILQVVEQALPSAKQASPRVLLNLGAGFVLCSLFGLGAIFLVEMLNRRVRSAEEAGRLPNVEVIAAMPKIGRTTNVVATIPRDQRTRSLLEYQDSVRALRNSAISIGLDRPFRSLVITSPRENENSSNIGANLAFSWAMLERKVLLIDANLREPSLHAFFEKSLNSGLAEVIAGEKTWNETIVRVAREQLFLMPAGVMTESSSDLLSTAMPELLESLHKQFDLVLIVAPPVLVAPESAPVAGFADAVLVMARAHSTVSRDIKDAYSLLRRDRANIIGMVVNDVKGLARPRLYMPAKPASRAV
jgi:polysaccharide biosynthesis transport protein